MGLLHKATGWLDKQLNIAAGVTVAYVRGATVHPEVKATYGRTLFTSVDERGPRYEFTDRDYLIDASEFPYQEPVKGDQIQETLNGETKTFEVTEPGNGEPAWRWSDQEHTVFRLHTKQVG